MAKPIALAADHGGFELVDLFLNTPFEGGRHEKRIAKLMAIETR